MPKIPEQVKMEKKVTRLQKRILGYNFQLPAYTRLIRRVATIPVLDSNMVNFLQALLDQLLKIANFESFQECADNELDLNDREVILSVACTYCGKAGFISGLHLIAHLCNDGHEGVSNARKRNRFLKRREAIKMDFVAFLEREKDILLQHHFRDTLLEPLVDFYFFTKSFLAVTSRYLTALEKLDQRPSMAIGRGVDGLLGNVVDLIDKAQCIESVPQYNTLLFQYPVYSVAYTYNGVVFLNVSDALSFIARAPAQPPQNVGNIFSLPRPSPPPFNGTPIRSQVYTGQNLHMLPNRGPHPPAPFIGSTGPPMGRPIIRSAGDISPFVVASPPRMVQVFPQPFMLRTPPPSIPMNAFPSPRQIPPGPPHHRRMLFNPSTPPPQSPPSPMFLRGPPQSFLPLIPPQSPQSAPSVTAASPGPLNNGGGMSLPPLNETGTANQPIVNEYLKRFLEDPKLDDLIETGNTLVHFGSTSLIPSELARALKGIVPEGQLKIECFGAKVSGVGYETDNLNLFVDDGTYPKTPQSICAIFEVLLKYFTENCNEWVLQNYKMSGLWTHLKVKNCCENVYCQISFASEPYCASSRLIRYYAGHFPTFQKLCYFVQEFAKFSELNFERNVIVLLVIFFLQMQNALPTVRQLQANLDNASNAGSWLLDFKPLKPSELKLTQVESDDIRKCARAFFHFYGHKLSLADYVVCPYDGQVISRSDFALRNEWRVPQKRYLAYLQAGQSVERLDVEKPPMCVQDLFVLNSNIAAKVGADDCQKFVRLCRMAEEFYANNTL